MELNGKDVRKAYDDLRIARADVYNAKEELTIAQNKLAERENKLISEGVEGSNAEKRKANLEIATETERKSVFDAEQAYTDAKFEFEQNQTNVRMVESLLMLDDINTR